MATPAAEVAYPHIVKTPGVRGGKARIDGTRICVVDLVYLHKWGYRPEDMREYYSDRPLTLAEVHSALAYYYDHSAEIEGLMKADSEREAEDERRWQELLAKHGGKPPANPTPEERAIPRPIRVNTAQ